MKTKKKRICLDVRMYQHSGIGVYILQWVERLKNDATIELTLLVPALNIEEFEGIPQILFRAGIYSIREQIIYPFLIPSCDIFWSPHYNVPLLPVKAKKRWVTIHDVYHLRFAHTLPLLQRIYARIFLGAACRLSDKIITVSEFSAQEIQSFFNVRKKIEIRHNTVDSGKFSRNYSDQYTLSVLDKYQINFPYLLFVGNMKPHKNLITLIKAFERIIDDVAPVRLLIVGKKEGFITSDNEVRRYMEANPQLMKYVHLAGIVEHDELPVLYQQAKIFIFPSLYEGFGYPPLEALAAGTKVICSNAGPMPEVCGDAVDYFNPHDVAELATLIRSRLLSL